MHDGHPHGSCGDCASFIEPFVRSVRFAGWGYCREQVPPPPRQVLDAIEGACRTGDRTALRQNEAGLFRADEDDCCDFFQERL